MTDTSKLFEFDLHQKAEFLTKFPTKFHDMVTIRQNRKDHSVSAIFLIYSIFSNRNQISFFSNKVYHKLITMTGKKVGVPVLVGEL